MAYVAKTPGQKCQRCGSDISHRNPGTKWCFECGKKVTNEKNRERKAYLAELAKRDELKPVQTPVKGGHNYCTACKSLIFANKQTFCSACGQRLDWSGWDG